MNKEAAFWYLQELEESKIIEVLNEWKKKKNKTNSRQNWKVIPANMLIKEWKYNHETGQVHESVIEKIQKIIIDNYQKIYINTVICGHTALSSYVYLESYISEDWEEEDLENWFEDYEWFICDDNANWRITDYGLDKIGEYVISLLSEEDYNKKLYWIDLILNVAHQRSDLASWFVQDGSYTLSRLAND